MRRPSGNQFANCDELDPVPDLRGVFIPGSDPAIYNYSMRWPDSSAHDAAAAARLPGPDYYEVLSWLHEELRPAVYVEIGVGYGESLKLALPGTKALGIDPHPLADHPWRAATTIVPLTSEEYFARHRAPEFSLAFIDGLHLFEHALADLLRLAPFAAPGAVIALHDTVPLDRETASRVRTTEFYTGDVWKVLPFLTSHTNADAVTVATAPSGLTLIRGLEPAWRPPEESVREYIDLPWERYEAGPLIPNERSAVAARLLRQ